MRLALAEPGEIENASVVHKEAILISVLRSGPRRLVAFRQWARALRDADGVEGSRSHFDRGG